MSDTTPTVEVSENGWFIAGMAFVMLAITVGVLIVNLILVSGSAREASQTHAAVCTYRDNLIAQTHDTRHYLHLHPEGAPALGLSASSIRQTLDREQAAVTSLSGLNCK